MNPTPCKFCHKPESEHRKSEVLKFCYLDSTLTYTPESKILTWMRRRARRDKAKEIVLTKAEALVGLSALSKDDTRELIDMWQPSVTDEQFEAMWAKRTERVVTQ